MYIIVETYSDGSPSCDENNVSSNIKAYATIQLAEKAYNKEANRIKSSFKDDGEMEKVELFEISDNFKVKSLKSEYKSGEDDDEDDDDDEDEDEEVNEKTSNSILKFSNFIKK